MNLSNSVVDPHHLDSNQDSIITLTRIRIQILASRKKAQTLEKVQK
jgi:hypothetical protein